MTNSEGQQTSGKIAYPPEKNSERNKSQATAPAGKKETALLFIKMLVTIFLCETAIMALLQILPLESGWNVIAYPVLLTILGTPILYWLLVRPIWLALEQRNFAMESLRESTTKLTEAQSVAHIGNWSWNLRTNELLWSEENYRIFGLPPDTSPSYEAFEKTIHPEDREFVNQSVEDALKRKEQYDIEFRIILPHDKERIIHALGKVDYDKLDKPLTFFGTVQDITKRKQVEEKLRFLSSITEQMDDSVVTTDLNYEITWVNNAFQRLYGYSPEEVLGRTPDFPNVELNSKEIQTDIYETVSSGKTWIGEILNRKKDGSIFPCELMIFPLLDEQGNIKSYAGHQRDITERKNIELALRKSEERFDLAAKGSNDGLWDWPDTNEDKEWWSARWYELLGYEDGEIEATFSNFKSFVHPDDLNRMKEAVRAHFEEHVPFDIEYRFRTKSGEYRWFRGRGLALWDENGKPYRMSGSIHDITDRKETEEQLQHESFMRKTLLDHLPCIAMILKKGTREIVASNEAARKIGAIPGTTCYVSCAKRDKPCPFCRAPEVWATNEPRRFEPEYKGTYYDGIWVPLTEELYVHYIFDISERKKAELKIIEDREQLKSLASQLSLSEESERRRIATELHDQIGQSLVFSKIKLDELHDSATSGELTKALNEICNNIGQIIQDTRSLTFDLSSPILNELGLEAAVSDWLDVQIREKHGIETEFEDDGQQKPLDNDIQALLFRNVRELLVNIIKHAHANKVKVSIRRVNEHIHIYVEDDGKGFDSVKVTSSATKDTKFGLFSIRQRLEQLGGQFEIDSEPGRGSRFSMTVPLKRA